MLQLGFEQSTGLALSKVEAWGRMSSPSVYSPQRFATASRLTEASPFNVHLGCGVDVVQRVDELVAAAPVGVSARRMCRS